MFKSDIDPQTAVSCDSIRSVRTSPLQNSPLRINELVFEGGGRLGLTFCPGKKQSVSMTGGWDRDLDEDIDVIDKAGYCGVVTLMQSHELVRYQVSELPDKVLSRGLFWKQAPILDEGLPSNDFEASWSALAFILYANLKRGSAVLLHCKGGLGRTGLVAARFLIEVCGIEPSQAILTVRRVRSLHAIDTGAQEKYVQSQVLNAFREQHSELEHLNLTQEMQ